MPKLHGGGCYLTRIRSPMRRAVGSMPGIERDQLDLRQAEAGRDHGERVPCADAVEAARRTRDPVSSVGRSRSAAKRPCDLDAASRPGADEQHGHGHGGEERERRPVPRGRGPVYQPEARPDFAAQPGSLRAGGAAPVVTLEAKGVDHGSGHGDERARRPAREGPRDVGRGRALSAEPGQQENRLAAAACAPRSRRAG